MRGAIARFRRRTLWGLPAGDLVLAAALCVIAVASVLTGNPDEGPLAVTLPVAIVSPLALVWRRARPTVTIALLIVTGVFQTLLAQTPGSLWSLAVYVIATYSLAAWSTEAIAAIAGAVFVAALLVQERLASGVDYVFILLLFGGAWLLGRAGSTWRGRVTVAEQRQREAARLAAAEERLRIARDLHDVVAHSLGAIAVQADAAEAALQAAPERAAAPVQAIRATAREALAEIREVLDVLRRDDPRDDGLDEGRRAAAPMDAEITRLVHTAKASGMTVELEVGLQGDATSAPVERACYRIVQEALTNARRHAPGAAVSVRVAAERGALNVRVVNAAAEPPAEAGPPADAGGTREPRSGYGIRGMRERVLALGGALAAGPTADGGFEVRAELPLRAVPAPEAPS